MDTECTQCGACLNTCPVFLLYRSEEYSPKAKQQLLHKAWKDDGDLDWRAMMDLVGQCACCERCRTSCARQLSVPEVLSRARARHPRWQQYVWREWVERGGLLWGVAARVAPLVPNAPLPRKLGILHASALAMKAPAERPAWLRLAASSPRVAAGERYVVFHGCTAMRLRPQWRHKVAATIENLGGRVLDGSGFGCCGGTYAHAGLPQSAARAAAANLRCWEALGRPRVIVYCASCLHSLRGYDLTGDTARAWQEALLPLSSLLGQAQVETTAAAPAACAYHSPCHWGPTDPDRAWLSRVLPGLRQGSAPCCGFGGVLKMLNPELSKALAERCWEGFARPDGQTCTVLTGCSGCTLQLAAHAPAGSAILHWLDIWQPDCRA